MKIAVTGAAGFIGSVICKKLEDTGHEVVKLIRPSLDNQDTLARLLTGVNTMVHCAWIGHPRQNVDLKENIFTSATVARAADMAGIGHMVFMSSGGGIKGTTDYATGKYGVEGIYDPSLGLFKFDLTVIRPTAVYGPGQDTSKGLGAVVTFLNAVTNNQPIQILGSPYSGRDFLYVGDLAECVRQVIEQRVLGTFEVGGPEVVSLDLLVFYIEEALGKKASVQIENPSGVDPQIIELDNTAITNATGWLPKTTVRSWLNRSDK